MMQLTLPFPDPSATSSLVKAAVWFHETGKTLLDPRRTPKGSKDHRLTDHEVELVRQVYEMGGISLREIAEKFEVSKQHIHDIVTYRRRPYAC